MRKKFTLAAILLISCSAACAPIGGGTLSATDKRVCADAADDDALAVYMDGPNASRSDIRDQAMRITEGSQESVDIDAVNTINGICKAAGYSPAAGS